MFRFIKKFERHLYIFNTPGTKGYKLIDLVLS